MEPYSNIASVYDYLLRHVDYQEWYDYIKSIMIRYIENPRTVVELGCGTGRFGIKFSNDGYRIYGIDKSLDMLRVAKTRAYSNFRILCADITKFYISKKVDFLFSVHDTMNYLLTNTDIRNIFKSALGIMNERSIFMFDITTEYNINNNFDGKISKHNIRGTQVEWSNRYDIKKRLVYSTLKFNKKGEAATVEEHVQRIYSVDEMNILLHDAGLEVIDIFGDYTFEPPCSDTIMINFITRKS